MKIPENVNFPFNLQVPVYVTWISNYHVGFSDCAALQFNDSQTAIRLPYKGQTIDEPKSPAIISDYAQRNVWEIVPYRVISMIQQEQAQICSESIIKNIIDYTREWEMSLQLLGKLADNPSHISLQSPTLICPDCKGRGYIDLMFKRVPCLRCQHE